jgi:hypothetical protein
MVSEISELSTFFCTFGDKFGLPINHIVFELQIGPMTFWKKEFIFIVDSSKLAAFNRLNAEMSSNECKNKCLIDKTCK